MKKATAGFSLIELFVSIAIVSILASIATPLVKNYLIRSRVTDMLISISPLKTEIEYRMFKQETHVGITVDEIPGGYGSYMEKIAEMQNGAIKIVGNAEVSNLVLLMVPTYDQTSGLISWTCQVENSDHNKYVPQNCQAPETPS